MEVYIELAFAENFLLDGLLLFLALKCARARVGALHLLFASLVGAAEGVLFPLFDLPPIAAYPLKLLGGVLIAVLAVSKGTGKTYLAVSCAFVGLTFALGGALTAVYSFFSVPYLEGSGYIVEQAPVGLIFGGAGCFGVLVFLLARRFYAYRRVQRSLIPVVLRHHGREIRQNALADSGNTLTYAGEPVCVLSPAAALLLFGRGSPREGVIRIETVNGGREASVFRCERLQIGEKCFENVLFTVGQTSKHYPIILHTDFAEGDHADHRRTQIALTKDPR